MTGPTINGASQQREKQESKGPEPQPVGAVKEAVPQVRPVRPE